MRRPAETNWCSGELSCLLFATRCDGGGGGGGGTSISAAAPAAAEVSPAEECVMQNCRAC